MIRIAICDDEQKICSSLEAHIETICKNKKMKQEVDVYHTGEEFLNMLEENESYDILFLDIELSDGINGVGVGKHIREKRGDNQTQIIFISGMEKYALQLFDVQPINFLIKPVTFEQVEEAMEKALLLSGICSKRFCYKQKQDMHFVNLGDIVYFKSNNRKIHMELADGNIEFYGNLEKILQELPRREFLCIHKSYIVNSSYVEVFGYESVTLVTGEVLPISQSRRKEIRLFQIRIREN